MINYWFYIFRISFYPMLSLSFFRYYVVEIKGTVSINFSGFWAHSFLHNFSSSKL